MAAYIVSSFEPFFRCIEFGERGYGVVGLLLLLETVFSSHFIVSFFFLINLLRVYVSFHVFVQRGTDNICTRDVINKFYTRSIRDRYNLFM